MRGAARALSSLWVTAEPCPVALRSCCARLRRPLMMTAQRTRLLVVENDRGLRRQLTWALDAFELDCASTRAEALSAARPCARR